MTYTKTYGKFDETVEKEEYRCLLSYREPLRVERRQAMFREWALEVFLRNEVGVRAKQGGTAGDMSSCPYRNCQGTRVFFYAVPSPDRI